MKESLFTKILKIKIWFRKNKVPLIPSFLDNVYRVVFSCDIPSTIIIGDGCKFAHHGLGCVVHPSTIIGHGCKLFQNVTISSGSQHGAPTLGNNVYIGAGACVLGNIKIGNNVKIGANSVVLIDIPDNSVVVGIPSQVISQKV